MNTTLTHRLAGLFRVLARPSRRPAARLDSLHFNGHQLADLNLPADYRARIEALRLKELGDLR